jgi:1-acyl-sn-glycerol-3-phosphate acyltransferase
VLRVRCADGGTPAEARARLRSARVIVSNHLSQADSWPFRVLTPIACVIRETYLGTSRWLPVAKLTTAAFDPIYVPTPGSRGEAEERAARAATKAAVERHVRDAASKPLLYFPEGSITNGRGLMRFSAFVFGLDVPVTPVAVSFWEPWPLALDTVWSPLHWNLLRMAYQPCHVVELAVLPTLTARAGEEPPAFAERTATDLANELGIAATPHTTEEKRAAMKKLKKAGQARVLREGPEAVLRAD